MKLLERVHTVLTEGGLHADLGDGEISAFVACGAVGSRLKILHQNDYLKVFLLIPIFAPVYKRAAMAEALTRANWSLTAGTFEMDWDDGEIRFRNSIAIPDDANPTDEQIKHLVYQAWGVARRYSMALMEVSASEQQPEVAIEKAEAGWREEQRNMQATVN